MRKTLLFSLAALLIVAMAFGGDVLEQRKAPVAASGNTVASTTAGWLQLTQLTLAGYQFPSVQYLDTVAWIAGYKTAAPRLPLAYRSIKGGDWAKITLPGGDRGLFTAWDANLAVYANFSGKMFRTTNGGTAWDSVYYYGAGAGWFDGVRFLNKDTVLAYGDADASGLLVIRSTDGGATWTRITNLPAEDAIAGKYAAYSTYDQAMDVYGNNVWLTSYETAGTPPRILHSTDAGTTWTSSAPALTGGATPNYYIRAINFLDENVGYLIDRAPNTVDFAYYHKTTDGGLTWSDTLKVDPVAPHSTQELRSVKPVRGTSALIAVGQDFTAPSADRGRAWLSTDGGSSWTPAGGIGSELYNSAFKDLNNVLAVGYTNALKYTVKNVYKVTFNLNTATVPDTLPVTGSTIQIRGGVNAGGFSPITWGNDAQNQLTSVGGDYWRKTVYMQAGDTLRYKYVIEYGTNTGWEQGGVPADFPSETNGNRSLIVPDKDTTLNVEFWNNGANDRPQYFRPWPATPDSFINVWFRVSMAGQIASGTPNFKPTDTLAVRGGGGYTGADLDWGRSTYMTKESAASNGGGYTTPATDYWSVRLRFLKDSVTEGQSISYKFLIGYDWRNLEESNNRTFTIPVGKNDTTLKYVWYNNEKPVTRANPDTVKITFIADLGQAAASGGFNVLTDTLWARSGYIATSATPGSGKRMSRVSGTIFQAIDTVITAKKKFLNYQYYVVRNGTEIRENYYNFYYTGPLQSEAEKRQILVDSLASKANGMTIRDTSKSITQARRQPLFSNARVLARAVNVKWEVDLRPAYYQVKLGGDSLSDIQGTFTVRVGQADSIMKWGVWMNGPAVGGWSNDGGDWGLGLQNNLAKKMYDDGTNGDRVAGDSIFTRQVQASPDSINSGGSKDRVGQTFKFGIRGGDNEGGRGGFGNNHTANIIDADSIYTLNDQFGSINPAFYDAWNYDLRIPQTPTSVIDGNKPLVYELAQNYPNPFNPTTKIEYSIPAQSQVVLKIYNIVGQEVATLVNEVQKAGIHNVKFGASNLSSGVYFYRLTAGDFTSVKKMVLLK